MSRRRCCCGCQVFYDRFDRPGPTQDIGTPWDWVNAQGEWWITESTQPKYPDDSALYEVTGTGEIIGPKIPENIGYQASYDVIDELPYNVYRIIFGAPEDVGRPGVPPLPGGECIIAEYEVGPYIDDDEDGQPDYTSCIRVYTRDAAGNETLIKEKYIPPQATNAQNGRRFYAHWINTHDDNTFCAWIGSSAYPSLVAVTGLTPPGRYFGAANASGSEDLPIEIDDYELQVLDREGVNAEELPCFACTCVCYDYEGDDPDNEVIDRQLYPGILHLRFYGECCDPLYPECDTDPCVGPVDISIDLEFENDILEMIGFNGWHNHTDLTLCGYPFQFRAECDANGILVISMYYKPYVGAEWQQIITLPTPEGGSVNLDMLSHTCTPIAEVWQLTLKSLSGFPCCLGCTTGAFYIVITA